METVKMLRQKSLELSKKTALLRGLTDYKEFFNMAVEKIEKPSELAPMEFYRQVYNNLVKTYDFQKEYIYAQNWHRPYKDYTNKIQLFKYCNSGLGYGCSLDAYSENIEFHLLKVDTLSSIIYEDSIIGSFKKFEDLRKAFFKAKENDLRNYPDPEKRYWNNVTAWNERHSDYGEDY